MACIFLPVVIFLLQNTDFSMFMTLSSEQYVSRIQYFCWNFHLEVAEGGWWTRFLTRWPASSLAPPSPTTTTMGRPSPTASPTAMGKPSPTATTMGKLSPTTSSPTATGKHLTSLVGSCFPSLRERGHLDAGRLQFFCCYIFAVLVFLCQNYHLVVLQNIINPPPPVSIKELSDATGWMCHIFRFSFCLIDNWSMMESLDTRTCLA